MARAKWRREDFFRVVRRLGMGERAQKLAYPNYSLSSSYSRLKQIWFPHTLAHTHTHTSGEKRISSIAGKNPFIEFFFSLFSEKAFPLLTITSPWNSQILSEIVLVDPLSSNFPSRWGEKNFFPMTKGKFTWSFRIGLSFMAFFAFSHYFSVVSGAKLTSMNKFPAKFCKV